MFFRNLREDRIDLERFLKRSSLSGFQNARGGGPRVSEPAIRPRRRSISCANLRVHEALIAARATIWRNSQQKMQRFFEHPVGVSFPDRTAFASRAFVEPGFVPEVPEGQTHQYTPPENCYNSPGTWCRAGDATLRVNLCQGASSDAIVKLGLKSGARYYNHLRGNRNSAFSRWIASAV